MAEASRIRAIPSLFLMGIISGRYGARVDDVDAERAIIVHDGLVLICRGENAVEAFIAGCEPFIEHFCLEQRSREAGDGETRIRFARPEPFPHKRKNGLVGKVLAFLNEALGGDAERGLARNLLLHQASGRDVLNIQRTELIHDVFRGGSGRTSDD